MHRQARPAGSAERLAVLVQRAAHPDSMIIIIGMGSQSFAQMRLAQYDHMTQAFTMNLATTIVAERSARQISDRER